jgi:hypothetical protein
MLLDVLVWLAERPPAELLPRGPSSVPHQAPVTLNLQS